MDFVIIKITDIDDKGIHFDELGQLEIDYNKDNFHNELSKTVYEFLLNQQIQAELKSIAVYKSDYVYKTIIWLGGDEVTLKAKYNICQLKNENDWRTFLYIEDKNTKEVIHYPINFNSYEYTPDECHFGWIPSKQFFNFESALNFLNNNNNIWNKYWMWHTELEEDCSVLHIDYWENELKENFTERNLWSIILEEQANEKKLFEEKELKEQKQKEEEQKAKELQERIEREEYQKNNPWYYLEDELKQIDNTINELCNKLDNRYDKSQLHTYHNYYWDADFTEGHTIDTLGDEGAQQIKKRLEENRQKRVEVCHSIEQMKAKKKEDKLNSYFEKVDDISKFLKDPIIAKRIKELT